VPPITLQAFYSAGFRHPHLCGGTVRDWRSTTSAPNDAEAEVLPLRATATVTATAERARSHGCGPSLRCTTSCSFADYRIVPATVAPETQR
jgi:hypothetical protein